MKNPGWRRPCAIWAISDGRAGNRAQALGLAEALGRRLGPGGAEISERAVTPTRLGAALPAGLWHALGRHMPRILDVTYDGAGLGPPYPKIAVGAGRRVAPLVAALRRHGVSAVQILAPQMPLSAFDAVVAPAHDGLEGPAVIETLGAVGRITRERIVEEAGRWAPRISPLPPPRIAVLIGGPGGMAPWARGDDARITAALGGLAEAGWTLLVTTSRRTPDAVTTGITAALARGPHLIHTGQGDNPYPALLGHAEAALVTADSVNMASEAAASGLPVHILEVGGLSSKARAFHAALADRGISRTFTGEIGRWTYPPLAEADRAATLLIEKLALPQTAITIPPLRAP